MHLPTSLLYTLPPQTLHLIIFISAWRPLRASTQLTACLSARLAAILELLLKFLCLLGEVLLIILAYFENDVFLCVL